MDKTLSQAVCQAFKYIYNTTIPQESIQFEKTNPDFAGDMTFVVFPFLRFAKTKPEILAEKIGEYLKKEVDFIEDFNVVRGFLNLSFGSKHLLQEVEQALKNKNFGYADSNGKQLMIEYSSPNTNKPLHLGHIRNNLLGYSVAEILKACGNEVVKTNLVNDRGIHICKSMLAWQKWGNGETPKSSGIKGDHLVGKYYVLFDKKYKEEIQSLTEKGQSEEEAKNNAPLILQAREMLQQWENGNNEVVALWKKMNDWVYAGFDVSYKELGVDFDKTYYESKTYLEGKKVVQEGLEKSVFYKREDGSVWCDLKPDGLDEKLLLRSDGTSVYMTQDIGTFILRFKEYENLSRLIYTVGNEQDYHFKVLFAILKKMGYEQAKDCYHLSYGMVDLPSGKMKSREGTVVDADDLIAEMINAAKQKSEELGKLEAMDEVAKEKLYKQIGLAALKYFILRVDPKKRILFNPAESIDFNGNTGPFIQYTYARIQSIKEKSGLTNFNAFSNDISVDEKEKDLIKLNLELPQIILQAGAEHNPAVVANYTYELAKTFNRFYQSITILKETDEHLRQFRVVLCHFTGENIKKSLKLLGIEAPNQM